MLRNAMFVASLPFSEACERNKGPILEVLRRHLQATRGILLEVGAGTGQHAVHLARHLPGLTWQPTEQAAQLAMLSARIGAEKVPNLMLPLELEVSQPEWPCGRDGADAVFTANTFHIMSWPQVQAFFRGVGRVLRTDGWLLVYGPFRYAGQYTSHSNHTFDDSLRVRDPASGIRDFEAVDALAAAQGLRLHEDAAMPANNQLLVWSRSLV
jgi:cyclopropane fatty-acyl-phospholipid synthase-like methyltransferase